ncbi:integrin-linked kinase-associated serine/threonine phosphatase 2C isoform X2 [Xenopus laevis]|uniref:Integrin-linked kinase-associated serine/threonine phosphatase 2C n=1 Tax=Xenopus laevis TaxID=8355 RepID=A0A8J0V960_XENLA|nr:integrin-linked kinase-associated serine/threonine phosphatase 2C isoform X2 [Xenopus laevis]
MSSPAVSPSEAGPPDNKPTNKRKAETADSDSCEGQHQEKKVCKGFHTTQNCTWCLCLKCCFFSVGILSLKAHIAERRGEREELQDAHSICDLNQDCQPMPSDLSRLSYFAVFDGHGGTRASRFAAQNLHRNIVKKIPRGEGSSVDKGMKRCILDAFKQTDEDFLKQAASQKPAWKDGTTAICVLVADNILYIANLGDSRALLCRINNENQKHVVLSLSREHNPTQYEERMRIQKAGGNVRDGRVLGVLEVSRSIGDGQYKRYGVISTPEVKRCPLTDSDRFILLACDGLFKAFSAEEAVTFILTHIQEKSPSAEDGQPDLDSLYESACHRLANEAVRRGAADNVTVLLVQIQH